MEPLCGTDCRAFLSYLANHRSSLRACVTRTAGRALRAYFARHCGHFGTPGRYRFLLPDRPKKQLFTKRRDPMAESDYPYENTYPRECYADGCACSGCTSEGAVETQPGEICTATRYADSFA